MSLWRGARAPIFVALALMLVEGVSVSRHRHGRALPRQDLAALDASIERGDIAMKAADRCVLMMLAMERRSGELKLTQGDTRARVAVREGRIIRARIDDGPSGQECIFTLLGWASGAFHFTNATVDGPDEIGVPTDHLLLEGARRIDEAGR